MVEFSVINKRLHINIAQYTYTIMVLWYMDIFGDLNFCNIPLFIRKLNNGFPLDNTIVVAG